MNRKMCRNFFTNADRANTERCSFFRMLYLRVYLTCVYAIILLFERLKAHSMVVIF